jgi:hypothetical protein
MTENTVIDVEANEVLTSEELRSKIMTNLPSETYEQPKFRSRFTKSGPGRKKAHGKPRTYSKVAKALEQYEKRYAHLLSDYFAQQNLAKIAQKAAKQNDK